MAEPPSKHELPTEIEELLFRHAASIEAGFFSEADEQGLELMERIAEHAVLSLQDDPDTQEYMLALACETAGNWDEARRVYQGRLSRVDCTDLLALGSHHRDLALLHQTLGELNLAALYSAQAIDSARRFGMDDVLLRHWLPLDANIAIAQRRFSAALECYDESLAYLPEERMHDLERAKNLIGRAECQLGLQSLRAAQLDHDQAWDCLAPWSAMECAGGVQSAFSDWWALAARLWELEGDWEQATHAWQTALEFRRRSVNLWDEGCPRSLLPLAQLLTLFGDYLTRSGELDEAATHYAESDTIRRNFNLPLTPRQSNYY